MDDGRWTISIHSPLPFSSSGPAAPCRTRSRGTRLRGRSQLCRPSAVRRDANRNRADWHRPALCATGNCGSAERQAAPAETLPAFQRLRVSRVVNWNRRTCPGLTCAECDDAADWVVGRNPNGHAVAWNNFDSKAAHTATQLSEHFMPGVTLNAIETSAMHCDDRSLHVD